MTIYRITPADVETFTIVTNPIRHYVSSSGQPVTGSINVFSRRSHVEKDSTPTSSFVDDAHDDADISSLLLSTQKVGILTRNATSALSSSFASLIQNYLNSVNASSTSTRKAKTVDIVRFTPSLSFTKDTLRKLLVKETLNKYYKTMYPSANWAYTNYNALNFFSSSKVPSGSALLYPNIRDETLNYNPINLTIPWPGVYSVTSSFSFDFYINVRRTCETPTMHYNAGTIFHLSSSYALSIISGTSRDQSGRPNAFQLQLQLSHSADTKPSLAVPGTYPKNLVFRSDDNVLKQGAWHHVVVRWGTSAINKGTGSFNIDGKDVGTFVVPSGTIAPRQPLAPLMLCVGNYYVGDDPTLFFGIDSAQRDGTELCSTDPGDEPSIYNFTNPLNAEVHDLAVRRTYMSDQDIAASSGHGPESLDETYAFYLSPFFIHNSPIRRFVNTHGGVPQTPFFAVDGSTDDPFNVALSFGVGAHYINIENFVRDQARELDPRCHQLTASLLTQETSGLIEANDYLYNDPFVRYRNLLILPCDDGNFTPNYKLLVSESARRDLLRSALHSKYTDDFGNEDLSLISLDNMIMSSSLLFGGALEDGTGVGTSTMDDFSEELIGPTPENPAAATGKAYDAYIDRVDKALADGTYEPGLAASTSLAVYNRTRDNSSNQVTFFDISNIYYGKRILPGSFSIRDRSMSGSYGVIGINLCDDGQGNVYRNDCTTAPATWNSVGNIYYDEGIVVIKSPHLNFFGKDQYEMSFKGEQNVHVLKVDAIAPANQLNSSSNPCFTELSASGYITDSDSKYVYITGINFHDDNYNVVAKACLAQPIMKRHGARIMFKTKIDF